MALEREDDRILYLMQDMREFEPGEKVSAVVSACDSINYILEPEDLQAVFFCVSESLKEGGIFIFDINTPYKYEVLMADNTIAENRDEGSFIWDNYYDEESSNNEYELAVFVRNEDGTFDRFEEEHYQHGFTLGEVADAVKKAGLKIRNVYDAFSHNAPDDNSERLYYIIEK